METKISVLGSGSSGNAIYLSTGQRNILIDAGMSGQEIDRRLQKCGSRVEELEAVVLTHEHNDHIQGAGVLSRKCDIPIYANELTWAGAEKNLGKIKSDNQQIISREFSLGKIDFSCFSVSHDARDPVGFVIHCQDKKIGIATDLGCVNDNLKEYLQGLDFLILESNHDYEMLTQGPYPPYLKKRIKSSRGHLSNDVAAEFLPELLTESRPQVLLAHLSEENNLPELAYITIKNRLEDEGLEVGEDIEIDFTYPERPTELYKVEKCSD